jgi:hypothetical protein
LFQDKRSFRLAQASLVIATTSSPALLQRLLRTSSLFSIIASIGTGALAETLEAPLAAGGRTGSQAVNDFEARFTGRPEAAPVFARPEVQSLLSTLPGESFTLEEQRTTSTIADVPIPEWWQRERERADVEAAITETPLSGILLERESTTSTIPGDSGREQGGAQPSGQPGRDAGVAAPPSSDLKKTPTLAEPSPTRTLTSSQLAEYVARARRLIELGNIAGARLLLEPAAAQEDADALFALAETYDPLMLTRWRVIGPRSDDAMARMLYEKAAKRGHAEAAARLSPQPR